MTPPETFSHGAATLLLGDFMDVCDRLPPLDVVVTSPPYNLGAAPWARLGHWRPGNKAGSGGNKKWRSGAEGGAGVAYGGHKDSMEWGSYVSWQRSVLSALWAKLSPKGCIFYNHKPRVIGTRLWTPLDLLPPEAELRQIITWARPGGMNYSPAAFVPTSEWVMLLAKPGFRLKSRGVSGLGDVWSMPPARGSQHPAPFPLELPLRALEATSGEMVCDPFAGSGTTAVAALRSGRSFVGTEIEERWFRMAAERIRREPVR